MPRNKLFKDFFNSNLLSLSYFDPDFYNWNRVKLRYCDGASFAGDAMFNNGVMLLTSLLFSFNVL